MSSVTVSPPPSACRTSRGSAARSHVGARGAPSSPASPRTTPSTARTSSSASVLAARIAVSAPRACSGSRSSRCRPTPAWTVMADSECASTSWTSRAIRRRSSATAVRSRSARARRSVSRAAASRADRSRTVPATSSTTTVHAVPPSSVAGGGASGRSAAAVTTAPARSTAPPHATRRARTAGPLSSTPTSTPTGPASTGPHAYPATRNVPAAPTDTTTATTGHRTRSTRASGGTRRSASAAASSGRAPGWPCVAPTEPTTVTTASTTARNARGRRRSSGPMRRTLRRARPGRVRPGYRATSSGGAGSRGPGCRAAADGGRGRQAPSCTASSTTGSAHPRAKPAMRRSTSRWSTHDPTRSATGASAAWPAPEAVPPRRARAAGRVGREAPAAREVLEEPRPADHAHADVGRRVVRDVLAHHGQPAAVAGEGPHALRGRGRAVEEVLVADEGVPAQADGARRLRDGERRRGVDGDHERGLDDGHGRMLPRRAAPRRPPQDAASPAPARPPTRAGPGREDGPPFDERAVRTSARGV